jgi:putative transposase
MTDQSLPHRKIIRLPEHTYREPGAYFVTICCQDSALLFGDVIESSMRLNDIGRIAKNEWIRLGKRWPGISIDQVHVVMPNHVHGIVIFEDVPRTIKVPQLDDVIARYKADVTREVRRFQIDFKVKIWQRRFNDHVVRDENELSRIRQYIVNNPAQWTEDEYYGLR